MAPMRIAELSRRSGETVPTIKYYLREGLLPPGEPVARNQARYGERHVARLRLVRALREAGGLSVAAAGELVRTLDLVEAGRAISPHDVMGAAHRAVIPRRTPAVDSPAPVSSRATADTPVPTDEGSTDEGSTDDLAADPGRERARADADAWIRELGWLISPDAPAREQLTEVILSLRRLGHPELVDHLPRYADAARSVAEVEVDHATRTPDAAAMMTSVVVGTVLGEALLAAVRLLAHEHVSATRTAPHHPHGG